MSGGPKRNPDSLNTFGVVVVGISAAVMVYVAITALQAFYMSDTSELQTMQDYGGQDVTAKSHKADEMQNITVTTSNPVQPGGTQTFHIKIDHAMQLIADEAAKPGFDPSHMIPALPPQTKPTIQPIFGRPKPLAAAAPAPAAPAAGSAAGSAAINTSPTTTSPAAMPTPAPATAEGATGSGGHAR
ncbi:MAG TPA: hypothetical protein VGL61_26900 [Kofleriaceae bacterium]|jgi:hypothetical protein